MLLSKHKAKGETLRNLEKNKTITAKSISLFAVLFIVSAFFLYGYNFESASCKRFALLGTLVSAGGLISLFAEYYILKREMREREIQPKVKSARPTLLQELVLSFAIAENL